MKVLVAVDGSPTSLRAVQHAVRLFGDALLLTLINVHPDEHLKRFAATVGKDAVEGYVGDMHTADLKESKAWLDTNKIRYDVMLGRGAPAQTVAESAADGKFDLVVIGAKGRNSVADLVIGSMVTRLISISKVPVLVIT
jgi:nucleotide-binding universal stress UspA family protein